MKSKVLIANRGEIALRINRACKELGLKTVAVYSLIDQDSLHVKWADEAVCIGSANASDSYLNMQNIISAALATGCDAIHPGYGFLSENSVFSEMVENCHLIFVGPKAKTMALMGNKVKARKLVHDLGIPVVPGSFAGLQNVEEALSQASDIGYPVLLKACLGGGGKGLSLVNSESELRQAFFKTSQEAMANFGSSELYLEKFLKNPHHIEMQIFGDAFGNMVCLGERDCSMQRRNQKMIEETPSPFISPSLRALLKQDALKLASSIHYENAGTVEFLVDEEGQYYFIEMNMRLQVEHGITEMVTGLDLVKEQMHVAYGNPLSFKEEDVNISGHGIECRVIAENVINGFTPSPGKITNVFFPGGFGVRMDTHIYPGYEVSPFYDSLLAKVIVYAPNRREAIRKMRIALEQFVIEGVDTNIEFQYLIMHNRDFIKGQYDVSFIGRFYLFVKDESYERYFR